MLVLAVVISSPLPARTGLTPGSHLALSLACAAMSELVCGLEIEQNLAAMQLSSSQRAAVTGCAFPIKQNQDDSLSFSTFARSVQPKQQLSKTEKYNRALG